jgi:maleate isomerase
MYGWRARIGLMVPSSNTTMESEIGRHVPEGVSLHVARFTIVDADPDDYREMEARNEVERCADLLADVDPDVVIYGSTAGSFLEGLGYETTMETRLRETAGVPGIATGASIKRAFDALDLKSLVVVTPYPKWFNDKETEYLEESGYDVVELVGREIEQNTDIGSQPPNRAYRQARAIDDADADGVFISCTNYRSFEIIGPLEQDLGKPVVTSNQAALWDGLRTAGIEDSGIELGSLFDE